MLNLLLFALIAGAPHTSTPSTALDPEPAWMLYADCSAAHYADAHLIDEKRTAAQKVTMMDLGRRYSAAAGDSLRGGPGHHTDDATERTKAYVLEKTRLLSLRTQPQVQAEIGKCPALP